MKRVKIRRNKVYQIKKHDCFLSDTDTQCNSSSIGYAESAAGYSSKGQDSGAFKVCWGGNCCKRGYCAGAEYVLADGVVMPITKFVGSFSGSLEQLSILYGTCLDPQCQLNSTNTFTLDHTEREEGQYPPYAFKDQGRRDLVAPVTVVGSVIFLEVAGFILPESIARLLGSSLERCHAFGGFIGDMFLLDIQAGPVIHLQIEGPFTLEGVRYSGFTQFIAAHDYRPGQELLDSLARAIVASSNIT